MKLKVGDKVVVIAGKEKGKEGKIVKTFRKENKVIVENLNMMKKHQKPAGQNPGSIANIEAPIDASNVMIVGRAKIGATYEKEKKVRINRKTKKAIN